MGKLAVANPRHGSEVSTHPPTHPPPPPPPPTLTLTLCIRIVWMRLRFPRQTNATPCLMRVASSQSRGWESMGLPAPSPALLSATPTTKMQPGSSVPSQTSDPMIPPHQVPPSSNLQLPPT